MSNQWDNWRPKTYHAYCTHCGLVTSGSQKDRYWPTSDDGAQNIFAADSERYYLADEAHERGLEHNVSGGICSDCTNDMLDKWRAGHQPPPTPQSDTGA